jgi:2-polyprenyl-3-methyl-5-hydroxy-6-metoxy-1,4-benzoquinol methylase
MEINSYLEKFGDIKKLPRDVLLNEMDAVWDTLKLNNKKKLAHQIDSVAKFYSHPVWVLNGLFSELDPISKQHRVAIAEYIKTLSKISLVADYGGGSGVLARIIYEHLSELEIDIIEPYPNDYFLSKINESKNINYLKDLHKQYDVIIAQDVLEHLDDPIALAIELIKSVKNEQYLIFANCFYPDIKCHLPSTFYLRHTFIKIMCYTGLTFIGRVKNAEHILIFKKTGNINLNKLNQSIKLAKIYGPLLNTLSTVARGFRNKFRKYANI